ncbi:MAG TPA: hypothetical protein VLC09_03710, partial [Polyangiaceae bacterium]|nr:hypothetical protein [Polyangiaceae bacterium]
MTRRHSLTRAPRRSSVAFRSGLARTAHLAMLGLLALACSKGESPSQGSTGQPAGAASTSPAASSAAPSSAPLPAPTTASAVAVGPELVVVPGVGLSAIRFGATFDTLERQMTAKCEVRTETRCTFVDQAVDFTMKDGVVVGMKVNRRGRAVPGIPGRLFGFFKGFAP